MNNAPLMHMPVTARESRAGVPINGRHVGSRGAGESKRRMGGWVVGRVVRLGHDMRGGNLADGRKSCSAHQIPDDAAEEGSTGRKDGL